MMRDPEKISGSESVAEDLDDMLIEAGNDLETLNLLLRFFKEMYELAKPYTDKETKKISAPNNQLPVNKLPKELKERVDKIDAAFVETMSYVEWQQVFIDGYHRVKKKIDQQTYFGKELK